jgi:amidohydrolase
VGVAPGPITANSDRIHIDVTGAGGHGSMPQGTTDAVLVAAHLVVALHSGVVARACDPFDAVALTVGKVVAGEVANAIAGRARLEGTVRTRSAETRALVRGTIERICKGVAATFGADVSLDYREGYPATVSSEAGAAAVRAAATRVVGAKNVLAPHPTLAGEDMAYYLRAEDGGIGDGGAFFFVGSSPKVLGTGGDGSRGGGVEEAVPHHRSDFDIDERSLEVGASVFVQLVEGIFAAGKSKVSRV